MHQKIMTPEDKDFIILCRGREYIADDKYFLDYALSLEDTGTALNNPRSEFIINNFEHFKRKSSKPQKHYNANTTELLHSLTHEMNKCNLSAEDEEYLDELMGNDPMCMF